MSAISLLIVDDDEAVLKLWEKLAQRGRISHASVKTGEDAIRFLQQHEVRCMLLDIRLPNCSGFDVLEFVRNSSLATEAIVMTASASVEQAVQAVKMGVFDYLTKPFADLDKALLTVRHALERYELVQKIRRLQQSQEGLQAFQQLIGTSPAMRRVYELIRSIRDSAASVLIEGESGTGKERVARAICQTSPRAGKPFLVINCGAIPESLLESELFGHKKGAFTGAVADKKGLFEEAHGGTLFLDEIGEIGLGFQVKLLRVLQDGEYRRLGDTETRHADVRVIAATNRKLHQLVEEGKFREDLYYRLHVIGLELPPLRERKEDVPLLAYHFLEKYSLKLQKNIREFSLEAVEALKSYRWPGNVRELENVVERCTVLAGGEVIQLHDLPAQVLGRYVYALPEGEPEWARYSYREAKSQALSLFHRVYLRHLLAHTGGNISLASEQAGMDRSNFKKIIRRYDINAGDFKKE